tara:strand:+ start:171 stop:329 length:159 start_codon:yes stop_codon:yes gene_type:complete
MTCLFDENSLLREKLNVALEGLKAYQGTSMSAIADKTLEEIKKIEDNGKNNR